jgi:hypothetical protein
MDLLDLDLEEIVPLIAIRAAQASMDTKTPQELGSLDPTTLRSF